MMIIIIINVLDVIITHIFRDKLLAYNNNNVLQKYKNI